MSKKALTMPCREPGEYDIVCHGEKVGEIHRHIETRDWEVAVTGLPGFGYITRFTHTLDHARGAVRSIVAEHERMMSQPNTVIATPGPRFAGEALEASTRYEAPTESFDAVLAPPKPSLWSRIADWLRS